MDKTRADWYLKQWLKVAGKSQADMARELEWNKAKVSLTANGKQAYDRQDIGEAAAFLEIEPYELLMPPAEAMALRRLRRDAARIANIRIVDDSQE